MKHCPAGVRKAPPRLPRRLCFGLLLVSAVAGWPDSDRLGPRRTEAKATVTIPVTVCVKDEAGTPLDVKPLLLNSTANRPEVIDQKAGGGCYRSAPITLSTTQPYFVAAVAADKTAFEKFTLSDADAEKKIELRMPKQGGQTNAGIEICARDEGGTPLQITGVEPAGGQAPLTNEAPKNPQCYRVSTAAAGDYALSLTARSEKASEGSAPGIFFMLLILITGAGLLLSAVVLTDARDFARKAATEASVQLLLTEVQSASKETRTLGEEVKKLKPPDPPATAAAPKPTGVRPDGFDALEQDRPAAEVSATDKGRAAVPAPPQAPPPLLKADDAKLKYAQFSKGEAVEHFCLMPSGASSASNMVEEAKVELHEQSNGTYVAFRSVGAADEAWVFPLPNVSFSPDAFKAVFPDLTAQDYESGKVEPKRVVSLQPKMWKIL